MSFLVVQPLTTIADARRLDDRVVTTTLVISIRDDRLLVVQPITKTRQPLTNLRNINNLLVDVDVDHTPNKTFNNELVYTS